MELVYLDCKIYVGGVDLSGHSNEVVLSPEVEELDKTTFASGGWRERLGGLKTGQFDGTGFYDAEAVDDELFNQLGNVRVITVGPTDGSEGEVGYLMDSRLFDYNFGESVGQLLPFNVTARNRDTGLVRGTILEDGSTERSASFNGTAFQLGAVGSDESLYASLHVVSGSGTLDVTVESDDASGFASPVTRITFDQATATGGQFKSAAGPIADDWYRVKATVGSGTWKFAVAVGIR